MKSGRGFLLESAQVMLHVAEQLIDDQQTFHVVADLAFVSHPGHIILLRHNGTYKRPGRKERWYAHCTGFAGYRRAEQIPEG